MKVTKEQIKALNPCRHGWERYLKNQEEDLLTLLLDANKSNPSDARWLFTRLMNKTQCMKIAVFSAREVLHIFEEKYPEDKRPRKAIEAVETCLKDPSERNRELAADAAAAAYAASSASSASSADAAAYAAAASYASSASSASYAVYAAAVYAAADAAKKELQEKIIKEAVRILETL